MRRVTPVRSDEKECGGIGACFLGDPECGTGHRPNDCSDGSRRGRPIPEQLNSSLLKGKICTRCLLLRPLFHCLSEPCEDRSTELTRGNETEDRVVRVATMPEVNARKHDRLLSPPVGRERGERDAGELNTSAKLEILIEGSKHCF